MRLLLEGMAVPVVLNDNVGSIDAARFATLLRVDAAPADWLQPEVASNIRATTF
jgi:hypothetical protein